MSAAPSPLSAAPLSGTRPLPRGVTLGAKVAMAVGALLLAGTAPTNATPTEHYAVPAAVLRGSLATIAAPVAAAPGSWLPLVSDARAPPPGIAPETAAATPQGSALRSFGGITFMAGLAALVGTAVWNRMSALNQEYLDEEEANAGRQGLAALTATALTLQLHTTPAAAEIRLPPLDTDPARCERAFTGNTIGQANGVSDKPLDLRFCQLEGKKLDGTILSGALMVEGQFHNASFEEAVLSKVYAVKADFSGANFTSAVLDRATFDGADMSGASFRNAVITGATFTGTNLANASFEEALIGNEDVKRLCSNPTVTGETRLEIGCRN